MCVCVCVDKYQCIQDWRVLDIEKIEQFVYFTYRDYKLSQNFAKILW